MYDYRNEWFPALSWYWISVCCRTCIAGELTTVQFLLMTLIVICRSRRSRRDSIANPSKCIVRDHSVLWGSLWIWLSCIASGYWPAWTITWCRLRSAICHGCYRESLLCTKRICFLVIGTWQLGSFHGRTHRDGGSKIVWGIRSMARREPSGAQHRCMNQIWLCSFEGLFFGDFL